MYHLVWFSRFRLVPFLTELRAVMDWVWTDTTLSLSNWICVEDIYANIFILKCWRESEKVTQTHNMISNAAKQTSRSFPFKFVFAALSVIVLFLSRNTHTLQDRRRRRW